MFKLRVNQSFATVDCDGQTPLLYVLRNDLALNGPKFGCGSWPVWRVHRPDRRQAGSVVRHAGRVPLATARLPRLMGSRKAAHRIRCSARSSKRRPRNAATARTG